MIAYAIGFVLHNLLALLFVVGLVIAAVRGRESAVERFLSWMLLLPIGIAGLTKPSLRRTADNVRNSRARSGVRRAWRSA
jgi:hypothetical protein